ncbi:MAG: PsiF family protein [Casimicrobiaceae bacterium]
MNNTRIALAGIVAVISLSARAEWTYRQTIDEMTGKPVQEARITSDHSLNLDFPYRGPNFGHLIVRQRTPSALDVIVAIDKGQIICDHYSGCSVNVRFDDGPSVKFGVTGPADRSSTVLFINDAPRFIASAKKAKRILAQLVLYQAGNNVLTFTTVPSLAWETKPLPRSKSALATKPTEGPASGDAPMSFGDQMRVCNAAAADRRGDERKEYMRKCLTKRDAAGR